MSDTPQVTVRSTEAGPVTEVVVPEEFQAIGFSGLFHTDSTFRNPPMRRATDA